MHPEVTPTTAPSRGKARDSAASPAVPTRAISVRVPEAVFDGMLDAARLRGHKTITDAVIAALHLYMRDALDNDEALQAVLDARSALEARLSQLTPQGN